MSLPWQQGSAPQHFAWFHWISHPRKTPVRPKHLRSICRTSRIIGDFSRSFVVMATRAGPQHFAWYHWIGLPQKPPGRCKHLWSICHTSRVICNFVPILGSKFWALGGLNQISKKTLTAKKWLDSINKQKRSNLKERDKRTNKSRRQKILDS